MSQSITAVIFKAILFVVLLAIGATVQMWIGWSGFLPTGLSMLPAFVFMWFHLPVRKTPDRFPADEAIVFYLAMLGAGYLVFDVFETPKDNSAVSWLMFLLVCSLICFYKFGKSQLSRPSSNAVNQSKS